LGSTGKVTFSGDLDFAIPERGMDDFDFYLNKIQAIFDASKISIHGKMISLLVPIQSYDASLGNGRTGSVQVDLMISSEPQWLAVYYHSSSESRFKGMYRNAAIRAIASNLHYKESDERDSLGRPIWHECWRWSSTDGLVPIRKESVRSVRTGEWNQRQKTTILSVGIKDPSQIAQTLFSSNTGPYSLDSVETLVASVRDTYDPVKARRIYEAMIRNMKTLSDKYKVYYRVEDYPPELRPYIK
jgi:hypothetical protein